MPGDQAPNARLAVGGVEEGEVEQLANRLLSALIDEQLVTFHDDDADVAPDDHGTWRRLLEPAIRSPIDGGRRREARLPRRPCPQK